MPAPFIKNCQNTPLLAAGMNGLPSPSRGEGYGEGKMILSSPPPSSSPITGEERFLKNWMPRSRAAGASLGPVPRTSPQ